MSWLNLRGKMPGRDTAFVRVATAALLGLVAGVVVSIATPWQAASLIGWDAAALTFLVGVWWRIGRLDATATASTAQREDPSITLADVIIVLAAVASIAGAGLNLILATKVGGVEKALLIALAVASIVVSWAAVHTVFTLRYARQYYAEPAGGIDFHDPTRPDYRDFAYVAFTVGMTFQVSDSEVNDRLIRRTILRHGLLSYLFGAVIIGLAINVLASLLR